MIDRNVRIRLLQVLNILANAQKELSVSEIIFELKRIYSNWFQVERRAIYADLKALEQFGYVSLRTGAANKTYAKYADDYDL
jgi:Fe2+ or Zn2+ uptake regulation protein